MDIHELQDLQVHYTPGGPVGGEGITPTLCNLLLLP